MPVYPHKRNGQPTGRYMVEVNFEGKRKRRICWSRKEARDILPALMIELKEEVRKALENPGSTREQDTRPTLKRVWLALSEGLWEGMKDRRNPDKRLERCCAILGWETPVEEVNTASFVTLNSVLKSRYGVGPATRNRHFNALNKLLKAAKAHDYIQTLPEDIPWQKEPTGRSRWIRDDELPRLLEALESYPNNPLYGRAAMAFTRIALTTGMRRGEIISINPETDIERLPESTGHYARVVLRDTKTSSPRTIEIDRETHDYLLEFAPWDLAKTGSKDFKDRLYTVWAHAKKKMGLSRDVQFVPHAMRHTTATWLVDANTNIRTIQEKLGHKQVTTTQRYAHVSDEARSAASASLQKRFSGATKNVTDTPKPLRG